MAGLRYYLSMVWQSRPQALYKYFIISIGCGLVLGSLWFLNHDLPEVEELLERPIRGAVMIESASGERLSTLGSERQLVTPIEDIPEPVRWAFLAAEDHRFFKHPGLDLYGILRAVVIDILAGGFVQGGSTITQQLAKVLFLTSEKSLMRKLQEAILAVHIERRFSKLQILEIYLNRIYFGRGATGIGSAAQVYFRKQVKQLTLAEMAFLAALPKAPSRYSSTDYQVSALARRNSILDSMVSLGVVPLHEAVEAKEAPLDLNPSSPGSSTQQSREGLSYALDAIYSRLEKLINIDVSDDLIVKTTLDLKMQVAGAQAIQRGLKRFASARGVEPPQGSLVAIDTATGAIRALVGGSSYRDTPYNRALFSYRQVGSAFKPFLYLFAIEQGMNQLSRIWDIPVLYPTQFGVPADSEGENGWRPENYSHRYDGKITLRDALSTSKNVAAVELAERVGIGRFQAWLKKDLFPEIAFPRELTLALGVVEIPLVDLANAYRAFANKGLVSDAYLIDSIETEEGEILYTHRGGQRRVASDQSAYVMLDMLKGVVKEGTGWRARRLPCSVGVKTGTTNDYRDAYYLGVTSQLSVGVWTGYDDNHTLGEGQTGSAVAGPIWTDFVREFCSTLPFSKPAGVGTFSFRRLGDRVCDDGQPIVLKDTDLSLQSRLENCEAHPLREPSHSGGAEKGVVFY